MNLDCILLGDCLPLLKAMPDKSVDLVMCSPPYEAARKYGVLDFKLKGQEWVDWAVERFLECYRVCKGLTAWVIEGTTSNFRWSATPALFMADLHRAGVKLRKPVVFHRVGIPGSGGPDWLRNDWEPIVCASYGRLPYSDNKAMGHKPKYGPGGPLSYRTVTGERVNETHRRRKTGSTSGYTNGDTTYHAPGTISRAITDIVNPGNVVHCAVGGGKMGSDLAHDGEAPYPEMLVEFFVRSFCPEGGIVLDPFCGTGTTLAVAEKWGRKFIGMDMRQDQVELSRRRVKEAKRPLLESLA